VRCHASILMLLACWLPWSAKAGHAQGASDLKAAGEHWRHGRVAEARQAAETLLLADPSLHEARRLIALAAFAAGDYERAITEHHALPPASREWTELAPLIVNAYEHLGRLAEAATLARESKQPPAAVRVLDGRSRRPLDVRLAATTIVPFADAQANPIADLIPALEVTINGRSRVAHLDTGGSFIVMSPRVASELGIATQSVGEGRASARATRVWAGIADELRIGSATLLNVPVHVVSVLEDADQPKPVQILLGTQLLAQFLTTWDNGRQQLVLSPRRDPVARQHHLGLLPKATAELDLHMLGDHFLLVKGAVGDRSDLVFFLDTGLVTLDPEGHQPALAVTPAVAAAWGLKGQGFSPSPGPIRLGNVEQTGQSVMTLDFAKGVPWHGVEVSALLAHGFLKRCVFTLDFDRHKLLLAPAEKPDAAAQSAASAALAGRYEVVPEIVFEVTADEEGGLYLRAPGQQKVPLKAEANGGYSIPLASATISFTRDASGTVTGLVLDQGGRKTEARRVP
jgi:hypothetical protein